MTTHLATTPPFVPTRAIPILVGWSAILFSLLYFLSDMIELAQGGFTTGQLALTLVAEAAIPFFVFGLYQLQRPLIGRVGLVGALVYAYTFVFFTGTVVVALATGSSDWDALSETLGLSVTVHGILMVLSGVAFGIGVIRAGVLPRWTGATLIAGVILVASAAGLSDAAQTASAGVRDLAFVGMGLALLRQSAARFPEGRNT